MRTDDGRLAAILTAITFLYLYGWLAWELAGGA